MTFGEDVLIRVLIFLLGVCGFLVARHIYKSKRGGNPLVCPIQFDCHGVVHSDYSKFFGIPLEVLGMAYYGIVSIAYLVFVFISQALPHSLIDGLVILSALAFIFSLYLIAVQIFILKKGCSWCFVSAFICILIFILTTLLYDFAPALETFL